MFNDPNLFTDAESYIQGFSFWSNDELNSFLLNNELSFSLEQLIFIRDYYKNVKKTFPTYNQIMLFDAINRIRKSQKKGYSIYSATADEGADDILQTSKDLLSKRKVIKRNIFGAMPISFAAEIASEYLNHIGYAERSSHFIPTDKTYGADYYIHKNDDIPLFVYSPQIIFENTQSKLNPSHNTIVMLYPTDNEDSDYLNKVNNFLALPEITPMISDHKIIGNEYGLFDIFINEDNGIFVNLSNIPEIEKDENGKVLYLTSLISDCIGKHIFSTSNASVGIINRIAESYSLNACIIAIRNNTKLFSFESIKNPAFSFELSFLKKLTEFPEHREYIFTDESTSPFGTRENVYLTDNRSLARQTHRAERILNFGAVMASATARSLNNSPHKSAALTVIDAINTLISKGVSKNSITLSIHYSLLRGTDDSHELGKNLASILGAYRSMIELCVSDATPQISYNLNARSIVVLASAKPPKRQIKSNFSNQNTYIYFYALSFSESGLPDYEKYRSFIKYYYSLIEKDSILSAISVNENFSTVLQSLSQNTSLEYDENFNETLLAKTHGIIFETQAKISPADDIFYIGNTKEIII